MLFSAGQEICPGNKPQITDKCKFVLAKQSWAWNSLLINMKMPTTVGIFIFMSKENFMFNCVEHEKKFYNHGVR